LIATALLMLAWLHESATDAVHDSLPPGRVGRVAFLTTNNRRTIMATTAVEIVRVDVEAAASWDSGWRVSAVRSDGTRDVFWSDADTLNDAIEEAIDRLDLPACRDDFGAVQREAWAIWERSEDDD